MKEKTILLHGYAGHDLSYWLQWLEQELVKQDKNVAFPSYENSKHPDMNEWLELVKPELTDNKAKYTLVTHSMGSLVALKLIESLDRVFDNVILVACPKNIVTDDDKGSLWKKVTGQEKESLKRFFEQELKFDLIESRVNQLHFFYSDDDYAVPFEAHDYYNKRFPNAQFKTFHNYGHFNRKNDIYTLPEILEILNYY